ncbi:MAG: helix-turn-helix domain-containing protein [Clostridia bacterium]|nr:helix-turn-helix domain-containing protein [Clostridia bacterium]
MDREVKNKTMYHAMFRRYPDVLKPEQVREMLGIGTRMTYRLLKSGEIQSVRMGRIYRVPKVAVIDYLCREDREERT